MSAVISIRRDRSVLGEPDVVRIDRATRWGNRFVIGRDCSSAAGPCHSHLLAAGAR